MGTGSFKVCDHCGQAILAYAKYIERWGRYLCWECVQDMDREEILEWCGFDLETAYDFAEDHEEILRQYGNRR